MGLSADWSPEDGQYMWLERARGSCDDGSSYSNACRDCMENIDPQEIMGALLNILKILCFVSGM
jgi:hypothetical protein